MGWKSSIEITREEATELIEHYINNLTEEELSIVMSAMFGDNPKLPYFGRNFSVIK